MQRAGKQKSKIERPANVKTDAERRQMLAWLVQENGGIVEVAFNSGMSRVHLNRLTRPAEDANQDKATSSILKLTPEAIEGLLTALNMSDTQAQTLLAIPPELHKRWTTKRPWPMGHVESPRTSIDFTLEQPLMGHVFAPEGYVVSLDPKDLTTSPQVAEFSGQLYVLPPEILPIQSVKRGRFLGILPPPAISVH